MNGHRIDSPFDARNFILAGKTTVTLKSLKTEAHLTYRVTRAKTEGHASHFVKVRTGGEGKNAWAYIGFIARDKFLHGNKSPFEFSSKQSRAFYFATTHLFAGRMPPDLEVWHEGKCGRCARKLSDPASIARGLGPECAGRV